MLIPIISNWNRRKDADRCRTRLIDSIARGITDPPAASVEYGRKRVVDYLDKYQFLRRTNDDQTRVLEQILHPSEGDRGRDLFLRTCCGLERPGCSSEQASRGILPAKPPVLQRAEHLRLQAELDLHASLARMKQEAKSAVLPEDFVSIHEACLRAAGHARFAYGVHSERSRSVIDEIAPFFRH